MPGSVTPSPTSAGWVPFDVAGQTFETHYRIYGDIKSKRPLVAVHGGPGIPSAYMEPFTQLATQFGIPVVLYDQFGCGASLPKSGPPKEKLDELLKDHAFWKPDLFMKELDNLVKHLKIDSEFDLLGHSWGGMLVAGYAIHYQPAGLKNLVLADTSARVQDWVDSTLKILNWPSFPRANRNAIKFAEGHSDAESSMSAEEYAGLKKAGITLKSKEYQDSLGVFLKTFVLRVDPWPESWYRALAGSEESKVGGIMFGPAWCLCLGTLKDMDATQDLHKIKARTLIYNGAYEQAQDAVVQPLFNNINKAKWIRFENSSHCPHYEEPERCMEVLGAFLSDE